MIGDALASLRDFTNAIGVHFRGAETDFQIPGAMIGEGDALIYQLKEAKAYRKHQMEGRVNPFEDEIRSR
jgi:hypothetical protein